MLYFNCRRTITNTEHACRATMDSQLKIDHRCFLAYCGGGFFCLAIVRDRNVIISVEASRLEPALRIRLTLGVCVPLFLLQIKPDLADWLNRPVLAKEGALRPGTGVRRLDFP